MAFLLPARAHAQRSRCSFGCRARCTSSCPGGRVRTPRTAWLFERAWAGAELCRCRCFAMRCPSSRAWPSPTTSRCVRHAAAALTCSTLLTRVPAGSARRSVASCPPARQGDRDAVGRGPRLGLSAHERARVLHMCSWAPCVRDFEKVFTNRRMACNLRGQSRSRRTISECDNVGSQTIATPCLLLLSRSRTANLLLAVKDVLIGAADARRVVAERRGAGATDA
jgi:hypothetical protein